MTTAPLRQLEVTDVELADLVEALWQAKARAIRRAAASNGGRRWARQQEAARYKTLAVKLAAPAPRSPRQELLDLLDGEIDRRRRDVDHRNQYNVGGTETLEWLRRQLAGRGS